LPGLLLEEKTTTLTIMESDTRAYERVLKFWSENIPNLWKKDPAFDDRIRREFGDDLQRAIRGELESWLITPRSCLAYVILLDQFSRNAFRGAPAAFAQDKCALGASLRAQELGYDRELTPTERWFLYMPMMHAEDRAIQERSVAEFARLANDAPESAGAALDYARQHQSIIERFGRFPHRNAVLGRESTPDEMAFLAQPGSSF
jgi:uncharacterized protein (DUF924 family)